MAGGGHVFWPSPRPEHWADTLTEEDRVRAAWFVMHRGTVGIVSKDQTPYDRRILSIVNDNLYCCEFF